MRSAGLVLVAALLCLPALAWAQVKELYQGKPSLFDDHQNVRVTHDRAANVLRFDGLQSNPASPRTPSWGCQGTGVVTISPGSVAFSSAQAPPFPIEKRDYDLRVEKGSLGDRSLLTFYGDSHTCAFDVSKASPWLLHLMMYAWIEFDGAVEQFGLLTESLAPWPAPLPVPLGSDWSSCTSHGFAGDPMSLDFRGVDIRDYFRVLGRASGLKISLDPGVTDKLFVHAKDVPWDMTLAIVGHRYGLQCKFDDKAGTLSVRKKAPN